MYRLFRLFNPDFSEVQKMYHTRFPGLKELSIYSLENIPVEKTITKGIWHYSKWGLSLFFRVSLSSPPQLRLAPCANT